MPTIQYAVVGEGYIAQAAILPSFRNASKNSRLTALVSGDGVKLRQLGKRYRVDNVYTYDRYDEFLAAGVADAVFIALPNDMHREYTVRSASAGLHVLCEKPMAVTSKDCVAMIEAAEAGGVKLMIAYRLHFEPANLSAIEAARSGRIGDPRIFTSTFTMQVRAPNIRLESERGGGPLHDIGIYCINAARHLFADEPHEVLAAAARSGDRRFREVDEAVSAVLRFPGDRLAAFTCSFGAADVSAYRLVGTEGDLMLEPAYEYAEGLGMRVRAGGRTRKRDFPKHDQFAAEIIHFSNCILRNEEPEPSGREGLIDVRLIEALMQSAKTGRPVNVEVPARRRRPGRGQKIVRPGISRPRLVHAKSPSGS